jgi:CheY-like chemotaxis protein
MSSVLLCVDDSENDTLLLKAAVRNAAIPFGLRQFDAIPSASAYLKGEGVFADRAVHPLPVAVLLDYQLSGFTAGDALPDIRKLPHCEALPFVILSGSQSPAKIAHSYHAGADHFLVKPSQLGRLGLILQTLYDSVTSSPPCYLALQALAEYQPFPISPQI